MRLLLGLLLVAAALSPQSIIIAKKKSGGGPTIVATDDFNRANGAIGSNWVANNVGSTLTINSNQVTGNGGNEGLTHYNATFNANQYASLKWMDWGGFGRIGPCVRLATTAQTKTGYCYVIESNTSITLMRFVDGSSTTNLATGTTAISAGDVMTLEVTGSNPVLLTCKINGVAFTGCGPGGVYSDSDASRITSGHAGAYADFTLVRGDDWEGGNL